MEAEFHLSERGKEILVLDEAKFSFCKILKNGETFWRCTVKSCKAKVWTLGKGKVISRSELTHSHVKDVKVLNRQIVSNSVKRKARDILDKPSKIIHSELKNHTLLSVKDISYIRNNLYCERKKLHPALRTSNIGASSDLAIEHVDVGSVSTSCEEQSDSNLEFLPESEEPPLPTTYPKPSSSSTLPPKDMKTYCRLCLKPVTKVQMICLGDFHDINYPSRTVQFKRNKILQTEMYLRMIRIVMPNFDHNLVFNPVMCNDCSTRLQMASDFVEQCMTTQKVIQEFKETHCPSEEMVSCEDVVYNKSLLQPDFEEGPTQPKQRKIVPKPSTSKSVAKSKAAVKPSPYVEQPSETQTFPPDEEFQHSSENIKIENMDGEEMEFEDKYEVTPEEICFIKQEPVEEAPRIKTDDAIHTNVPIKTEREYSLLTNSVVKSEPCSTSTSDYTIMTDPNNVKQFSAADVSCNLNSNNSSSLVHAVDLPSSSNIPISNYCPGIQNIAPEACINAVNPTAFSSVNSQFENSQNR